jgi:hypothetical protein
MHTSAQTVLGQLSFTSVRSRTLGGGSYYEGPLAYFPFFSHSPNYRSNSPLDYYFPLYSFIPVLVYSSFPLTGERASRG